MTIFIDKRSQPGLFTGLTCRVSWCSKRDATSYVAHLEFLGQIAVEYRR